MSHKIIIQVGFITDAMPEQMNIIQKNLTLRAEGKISFFEETDVVARQYIDMLWGRIITEKRIDLPETATAKKEKIFYENSMT